MSSKIFKLSMQFTAIIFVIFFLHTSAVFIPYLPCDPDPLEPCRNHPSFPESIICENIQDIRTFAKVLRCNRMKNMQEVFLVKSSIDHLPLYVMDFCGFSFLNLKKVVMNSLLEGESMVGLEQLHIDNVTILNPWTWEPLSLLKRLVRFSLQNMVLEVLDRNLVDYLSDNLQSFILTSTNTTVVVDYAMHKFTNMVYVSIQDNEIRELRRNMFPWPAKIKFFYFGKNKITSLPEDLFQDMPDLQIVAVQGNLISEIHEHTFRNIWRNLSYVLLEGNPLKCSCKMLWLTKRFTPRIFRGECYAPKSQFGKQLKELERTDFQCF